MSGSDTVELMHKLLTGLRLAVTEMMTSMAMSEVVFAGQESADSFTLTNEVVGLVRLDGQLHGMVGVSCSQALLREIVSRIVGLSPDELTMEDLLDGAAELANMVCGGMKTKAQIGSVNLSPPVAIVGQEYTAQWKTNHPTTVFTFQMDEGVLMVHASL
ncbi:MAG: chemotaxis protein CheX [Magnetococcales bacterium]|nr:chemotaxis protein CheX [Magnetococcales bacterium]